MMFDDHHEGQHGGDQSIAPVNQLQRSNFQLHQKQHATSKSRMPAALSQHQPHQPQHHVRPLPIPSPPRLQQQQLLDTTSAGSASPAKSQQAQQWLLQHGVQNSIDELALYVDAISSAKVQQAAQHTQQLQQMQQLHENSMRQQQQLQALVQQQAVQLQGQAQELETLKWLQPGPGGTFNHLYHEIDRQTKEAASWRSKYQAKQQCRDVAEAGLKETLIVVDQLTEDCAAISSMLNDVLLIEAAAASDDNGAQGGKQKAYKWVAMEAGIALLLVTCAAVATFLITRAVMLNQI